MRRLLILAVALCLLPSPRVQAQDYVAPPVSISKDRVRGSDGKVYYSHVVLERQTLFSISKAYGVTVDEIYEANPAANLKTEGLKKNSIILIPVNPAAGQQAAAEPAKAAQKAAAPEKTASKAQEKPAAAEKAAKPATEKKSVSETMSAVSSTVKGIFASKEQKEDGEFITHTVRWYEDIDDIAANYGVPVEAIVQANNLTSAKVKNRQKLQIPRDPSKYVAQAVSAAAAAPAPVQEKPAEAPKQAAEETVAQAAPETVSPATANHEVEEDPQIRWRFPNLFGSKGKSTVNSILLLPMKNATSMDFYSGFLLAVKELGEQGIGSELSVYDVSNGALPVTASRLAEADVVFGPIDPADITKVLNLADHSTAVVSPLDQKAASLVPSHRNLVQAPASLAAQYEDVIRWVRSDMSAGDKVIVISEKNGKQSDLYGMIERSGLSFTPFSYSILQGRGIVTSLGNIMAKNGVNRIILDSESEAFVSDVVRNLTLLIHNKNQIVVYGPSKIRSFDTIDVENLHSVNLHVSMSYYIDYDNAKVRDFLLTYRGLYEAEPNQFAFQGYDLATYFIKAVAEYGDDWVDRLETLDRNAGLQADFQFLEAGNGGLVNHGIRRAVYNPDFSVRIFR